MPFQKGSIPWNKGTKGIMKPNKTSFKKGIYQGYGFKKGYIPWHKNKKTGIVPKTAFKKGMYGEKAGHWKGGKYKTSQGYICIYQPEHPFCNKDGYVFESHLVIEKQIGRYFKPKELSHHINSIRDDNRPENLMVFKNTSVHIRFHKNPNNVKPSDIVFDGRKLHQNGLSA